MLDISTREMLWEELSGGGIVAGENVVWGNRVGGQMSVGEMTWTREFGLG